MFYFLTESTIPHHCFHGFLKMLEKSDNPKYWKRISLATCDKLFVVRRPIKQLFVALHQSTELKCPLAIIMEQCGVNLLDYYLNQL